MKKKVISALTSLCLTLTGLSIMPAAATSMPRDPNGDGIIDIADGVYISQVLKGTYIPSNLTPLDFDQNGVVTMADSEKVFLYLVHQYDAPLSNINDPVETQTFTARNYRRHDCTSTNPYSYTSYTLQPSMTMGNGNVADINTVFDGSDFIPDTNYAVVRINGSGGSGYIVGPHTIATAAHCVCDRYSDINFGCFFDISIDIVDDDSSVAIANVDPHYIHVPYSYFYNSDFYKYDYALIYVDTDLTQYGQFDLGLVLQPYITNEGAVCASGFPAGVNGGSWGIRYKSYGNILNTSDTDQQKIAFNASILGGNSGGPLYITENYSSNGIGVTRESVLSNVAFSAPNHNFGVRTTIDLLQFYYKNTYLTP